MLFIIMVFSFELFRTRGYFNRRCLKKILQIQNIIIDNFHLTRKEKKYYYISFSMCAVTVVRVVIFFKIINGA